MESIILLAAEWLLDPTVVVPALVVAVALISGLAARAIDVLDQLSGAAERPHGRSALDPAHPTARETSRR